MIFNSKKKALKKGELFLVKDLEKKFNMANISTRHITEHFSSKYMTWEELDSKLKMIGKREHIQDIIGLPPHLRAQVEKQKAKEVTKVVEEPVKEEVNMKDYLKNFDSEVKKANKDLKLDKNEEQRNKVKRPARPVTPPKPAAPNEDTDWLKAIPTEQQRASSREKEVQKDTNVRADFESAGGVK